MLYWLYQMRSVVVFVITFICLTLLSPKADARSYWRERYTPKPSATPVPSPTASPAPSVTPSPTPTVSNKLCFNYGHSKSTYDLNGQVTTDLNHLTNSGIKCIRLSYMGWNNTQSESLAVFAKGKGFRVILGGDWDIFHTSDEASYTSQVLQEAKWAQTNGIDQFSLGNENEYRLSGITQQQWADFIIGLSSKVRNVYSGVISYETSFDFSRTLWNKQQLGSIDLIGYNAYCSYDCNASYLKDAISALGVSHVYISETNADMSTGSYNSDSIHATEVSGDALKLTSFGVQIYYFTYDTCNGNNGVSSNWGLVQCGVMAEPLTATILGIK